MIDLRQLKRAIRLGLLCVRCKDNWIYHDEAYCVYCRLGVRGDTEEQLVRYSIEYEETKKLRPEYKIFKCADRHDMWIYYEKGHPVSFLTRRRMSIKRLSKRSQQK